MSRVLIVDDEPGLRQSLGLLLTDAGFEVVAESDGRRALERASQEPFDLIFSDVVMPGKDGLQLLEEIKKNGTTTPVIMMSGQAHIQMAIRATRLACAG